MVTEADLLQQQYTEAALESLGVLDVLYQDGDIPASVRPIVRAILLKAGREPAEPAC